MPLHIALVHFPTVDKQGAVTATSVTNLDLHDLARAGRTYGVEGYWLVHPFEGMQRYVERVMSHWREGWGAAYNPTRKQALEGAVVVSDLGEVARRMEALYPGHEVLFVATSARQGKQRIPFSTMRQWLEAPDSGKVYCILFGTGYGLHPEVMQEVDYVLEPINGPTDWNHLSVRAAAAITLDRLLGLGR
ncbi:MAG: RNA methyltransferase [Sumerlaeia bacterium]